MALDKRGAVIGMFGDVIKNNAAAPVNANVVAITALARRLERSCHNNTVTKSIAAHIEPSYDCDKFVAEYSRQCYLIAANLNTTLIAEFINGVRDPNTAANLTSFELNPSASEDIRQNIIKRRDQKAEKKISTLYTCSKCRSKQTSSMSFQSRSSDEANTVIRTCEICSHTWRES